MFKKDNSYNKQYPCDHKESNTIIGRMTNFFYSIDIFGLTNPINSNTQTNKKSNCQNDADKSKSLFHGDILSREEYDCN